MFFTARHGSQFRRGSQIGHETQFRQGEAHPNAKLTAEQALAIMSSSSGCITAAFQFGVNRGTIRDIRIGRTWAHVTGLSSIHQGTAS